MSTTEGDSTGGQGTPDPVAQLPAPSWLPGSPTATLPPETMWPAAKSDDDYPELLDLIPPVSPLPLLAILPARAKQRRWTVLLRAILAIPLVVVVFAVEIATLVCVVLGWFAALIIGRVPEFVRTIVTALLRTQLRLEAYTFLLTDRFPPFGTHDDPSYGTRLAVPPATKLNRAAVFFRAILVIPSGIALRVVGLGLGVVTFFMWFVVLITGWLPKPVHEANQVLIRYEIRLTGYYFLLVPTYPGELFGDLAPAAPAAPATEPVYGDQTDAAPPIGTVQSTPAAPTPVGDQRWLLILSMGAKRLLLGAIVLGVATAIGLGILNTSLGNHANLVEVNNQLVTSLNQYGATAENCGSVACLEQADSVLSQQLGSFVSALQSASHGGVSQSTVDRMNAAAQDTQRVMAALSDGGRSLAGYRALATKLHTQQSFSELASAQHHFVRELNSTRLG